MAAPGPSPAALTRFVEQNLPAHPDHPQDVLALALQVVHNLVHQHLWTDVEVFTHSALDPSRLLPRPLVCGLPPHKLYEHPDEQIDRVSQAKSQPGSSAEPVPEREWVLPARLAEKWSLSKTADVFDCIDTPPDHHHQGLFVKSPLPGKPAGKWRQTKRVVLATVDTDSTVVYYIVHDGIVKPRQN